MLGQLPPGVPIEADHVLSHALIQESIRPALGFAGAASNHQQVRVRQSIPVATGSGSKEIDLIRPLRWVGRRRLAGPRSIPWIDIQHGVDALLEIRKPLGMPLLAQLLKAGDSRHV